MLPYIERQLSERAHEVGAIGETRQRIVICLVLAPQFASLAIGYVL